MSRCPIRDALWVGNAGTASGDVARGNVSNSDRDTVACAAMASQRMAAVYRVRRSESLLPRRLQLLAHDRQRVFEHPSLGYDRAGQEERWSRQLPLPAP